MHPKAKDAGAGADATEGASATEAAGTGASEDQSPICHRGHRRDQSLP